MLVQSVSTEAAFRTASARHTLRSMDRGTHIKLLREQLGWTQADLAERAGYSESYVRHIESGRRPATEEALTKLGEALGVDLRTDQERAMAQAGTHEIVRVAPMSRAEVEAHAEAFALREYKVAVETGQPMPVAATFASLPIISRRNGIPVPVEVDTFESKAEGMTWCTSADGPIYCQIRAEVYDRAVRGSPPDRWSLAHEIAHPLLHYKALLADPGAMFRDINAHKPFERAASASLKIFELADWQANAWAAAFLISVGALRVFLSQQAAVGNEVQVEDIARHFQVSVPATEYRMRTALPALGKV